MLTNGAISWRSKKHNIVAQSPVEAEYIAMSFAVRETLWIKKSSTAIWIDKEIFNICIKEDNQGCNSLSKDNIVNNRSKHIDIKYPTNC